MRFSIFDKALPFKLGAILEVPEFLELNFKKQRAKMYRFLCPSNYPNCKHDFLLALYCHNMQCSTNFQYFRVYTHRHCNSSFYFYKLLICGSIYNVTFLMRF